MIAPPSPPLFLAILIILVLHLYTVIFLHLPVEHGGGGVWPPEHEEAGGEEDDGLAPGSPHQPGPVGWRRAAGYGKALEGVWLEGAGDGAQVVHDGEVLRPLSVDALLLELAGEGLEERAGGGASGHFESGFGFEVRGVVCLVFEW